MTLVRDTRDGGVFLPFSTFFPSLLLVLLPLALFPLLLLPPLFKSVGRLAYERAPVYAVNSPL